MDSPLLGVNLRPSGEPKASQKFIFPFTCNEIGKSPKFFRPGKSLTVPLHRSPPPVSAVALYGQPLSLFFAFHLFVPLFLRLFAFFDALVSFVPAIAALFAQFFFLEFLLSGPDALQSAIVGIIPLLAQLRPQKPPPRAPAVL